MFLTILIFCALTLNGQLPADLTAQICLDRAGFSCNSIDGVWGAKSDRAFRHFFAAQNFDRKPALPTDPIQICNRFFANRRNLCRTDTVTQADLDALVTLPRHPSEKAKLPKMGYESIREMFAERGHLSPRGIERLNPGVNWEHVAVGTKLVIPDFPSIEENLSAGDPLQQTTSGRPLAEVIRVSLSKFEITAWDKNGKCLALFPCSIARDKSKRPPTGEMKVVAKIPNPNYTYAPDFVPRGQRVSKHVLMDGPNNPVGVAWIGLSLPTYGIHGTPTPETIGSAESHGCFRLSNWNVARLYAIVKIGTKVVVEP